MSAAVLLTKLHNELLAVGDGELRHGKDRALSHLLVHDFPCDVIRVEGNVALVPDFRVEVNQPAVRIEVCIYPSLCS